ncbi:MAG: hypothetical protein Q4B19_08105, partial [Clostridia bacterium]|nr:hypothetical protein [Clostridia bacterium]
HTTFSALVQRTNAALIGCWEWRKHSAHFYDFGIEAHERRQGQMIGKMDKKVAQSDKMVNAGGNRGENG